jgi:hypothetical protein
VIFRITMNWNPSYSYATIPDGMTGYPAYWKILATPVPEAEGRANFHDVKIWNIKATGAKTAFEVNAYPQVRLSHFRFKHLQIEATTAGHIFDAKDWTFSAVSLKTTDDSVVALSDDANIKGIASLEVSNQIKAEPSAKNFAEQDRN